jgi:hypothetical protein
VWDAATTEVPPEEGEAPECQWCPICRAARRMRESGPGLGGQLTTAGEAVAAAVQDAINAFDSVLRTGGHGTSPGTSGHTSPGTSGHGTSPGTSGHGTSSGTSGRPGAKPGQEQQAAEDLSRLADGPDEPGDRG